MHAPQPFCLPPALRRALVRITPPAPGGVRQPGRAWWVLAVGAWLVLLGTVAPALAQSTDATLSGLTVSPTNITGFASGTTEYAVGVANDVTQATVTPTASDTTASITIDGTTVTSGSGHTVTLGDGSNEVSIVVTAPSSTPQTYTVSINRESTEPYGWKVLDDFNTLTDLGRKYFRDITSDGETMWVASNDDPATVFAFDMQTKARDADKDLVVSTLTPGGGNNNPWGLWTDGQTMWVAERDSPRKVFAYPLDPDNSNRERASNLKFEIGAAGNSQPAGMWSDTQTLWVVDTGVGSIAPKIFAYTLSNGRRDDDRDFNTLEAAGNTRPRGIWSDGEVMWVADSSDKKLYAYDMLTKAHVPAKDFPQPSTNQFTHQVWGIWSDGQTMWAENPDSNSGFIRSYVMPVSDGTRLRLVRIDGKKIDLTQTSPTHYVANTETQVTVEADALHFQAQAAITPADADTSADGHQVALNMTDTPTTITITVTAQDGTTATNPPTVTVTKVTPPGQPTDLELTVARESLTVTWTAPTGTLDITAYDMRYRPTNPTDSKWKTNKSIWRSGSLSYGIRNLDGDEEYEVQVRAVINGVPGQWSGSVTGTPEAKSGNNNLETLSVIIDGEEQIAFDPAKTSYTVGVASTVTQATISATVAHAAASIDGDDTRLVDLDPGGNTFTIRVEAENGDKKPYTVTINRASTGSYGWKVLTDIALSETTAPRGIWSDGETLWVADDDDDNLEAYDLDTGARERDRDIDLTGGNTDPGDIWSDGTTMWVADFQDVKVFAYDLASGDRKDSRDLNRNELDPEQQTAWDIWSDGETIWVNPHGGGYLYAHDLATGARKAGKDIELEGGGNAGMWSDGETLWMPSGSGEGVMVPYLLFARGEPVPAGTRRDLADANGNPSGVWSDAETLYVADSTDAKVYTYNVPKSANVELKSLSLSPVDIDFDAETTEYDIDVAATVSQVTVDAEPFQRWATIDIDPADADTNTDGHQVNLSGTSTDITLTVTAHNGTDTGEEYTVTVNREASADPPSSDATLSGLTLSAGRLSPTFRKDTPTYTAAVGYTVQQLTVTPTAKDSGATITINDTSVDSGSGHEVDLDEGTNTITITVTAEDGTTKKPYTVTVTRTAEDLSLSPSEGADPAAAYASTAVYTVTFEGKWTIDVTPDGLPSSAHFSRLIGGVHNDQVTFLESGGEASAGIEDMAELGQIAALKREIENAKPNTLDVLEGDTDSIGPEVQKTLTATLTTDHPRVTLTTMIAPSRDWFVGVSGLLLLDTDGRWRESHTVDLFPWDAGTEEGSAFNLNGSPTSPQGVITSIRGTGPFTTEPIATLRFVRQSVGTTRSLDENTGANVDIGDPVTVPGSGTVSYSLSGTDAGFFAIDSGTGRLKTAAVLNFENPQDADRDNSYQVTVTATDTGPNPAVTTAIAVTIQIINLDEGNTVSLSSSQPQVGTALTATLTEPDTISGSVTWMWERSTTGTSSWTTVTGASSGGSRPTYTSTYTPVAADQDNYLRATASYTDSHGTKTPDVVSANWVQAAPVMNSPPSFTEGSSTARSVDENTGPDTNIGTPVTATDPDTGDTLDYSLGGTDVASFALVDSGQLQTKAALDHETKASYQVTVTVSDSSTATDTITVTINVTDLNEPPEFTSPATFTAAENQTAAGTVQATDEDTADSVRYTITGGADSGAFAINETNGVLSFATAPNYEARPSPNNTYSVTVTATGGTDTRAMTADQTITVTVTNAQEAGTVSLSPDPPTVDEELTASLSDPDGSVTNLTWTWQTAANSTGPWAPIDGATAATYTPVTADARQYLRATAFYDDAQATGQSAQAVSAEVRSINADLRAILVNGADIFDPDTTSYIVGVPSAATQATLSASTADPNATVAYKVNNTAVTGDPQVTFSTTDNSFDITITVTAADMVTTKEYDVTIRRGVATVTTNPVWKVDDDIELSDDSAPRGVWSDGETLWVVDATTGKLLAYTPTDGSSGSSRDLRATGGKSGRLPRLTEVEYDDTKDITLAPANANPTGIWSDGTTIWVADSAGKLFAYTLATQAYDATKDIDLDGANAAPTGLWSDGTTIWVADATAGKLFAYTLDGVRVSGSDIPLDPANTAPTGIWSDGETLWVADSADTRAYAYSLATRTYDDTKDINLGEAGNDAPHGVWSDGETLWVADSADAKLFSYTLPESDNAELRGILVDGEAASGSGASYTRTVANDVAQVTVEPQPLQRKATATVTDPADAVTGTAGHQVGLGAGDNSVEITVTAQDGSTDEDYTLTITRTNSPPVFPELEGQAYISRDFPEDTVPNVPIGDPITATDDDRNPVTHSLSSEGNAHTSFNFDTTSGQLSTKEGVTYDHETTQRYTVMVTAEDSLGVATSALVLIDVLDVNEPPTFPDMILSFDVAEDARENQFIGTVAADDPESDGLLYSLVGRDGNSDHTPFKITVDSNEGHLRIRTAGVLNYEQPADEDGQNTYEVVVLVADGAEGAGNVAGTDASIPVTITVTDVNEAGTVSLSSDSPQALTPLTATLDDPDRDAGHTVSWQWETSGTPTNPNSWTAASGPVTSSGRSSEYATQAGDKDQYLRATASYNDRFSSSPSSLSEEKVSANPVQAAPVVELVLDPAIIDEDGGTSRVRARLTGGTVGVATEVTLDDRPAFDLSAPTLTIPANMTESESVTLTAQDNDVDDDASRTVEVTGLTTNPQVTGPEPVQLTITDDDTRGVTLSLDALTVREGENGTYTVVLASEPTAQVTVGVVLPADTDVRVSPQRLTFTTTNWDDEQMVTVTAAHDTGDGDEDDMATITHTVTSSGDYNGLSAGAVTVTVEDDEAESTAVELTVSPEAVDEDENPTTVQVTVTGTLNGKPLEENIDVTIMVTGGTTDGMATEGTDFEAVTEFNLMIEAGDPDGTATFELTLRDDEIDEPNETVTVNGNTALRDGVTGAELTIEDNDDPPTVELVLTPDSITEDGGQTTVTATLTGDTTSSVATEIEVSATALSSAVAADFTLSGTMLTIDAETTTSSGSVTLSAVPNDEDEADKTVEVSGKVTVNDTLADPEPVTLTITDDDPPQITTDTPSPTYVEGDNKPVATYTATNPDRDNITITWSLGGDDADKFAIIPDNDTGVLRFEETPDYEDANEDRFYEVTVTASDGTLTSEPFPVRVEVKDAPGELSLSPAAPRIGQEVRAILDDLDVDAVRPATDLNWFWEWTTDDPKDPNATAEWTPLDNTTASYTPQDGDKFRYLRVTLTYTDGDGTGPDIKAPAQVTSDGPVTEISSRPPGNPPGPSGPPGGGPPSGEPPAEPPAEDRPPPVGNLENPGRNSFQSGIGLISGWVCEAERVEIEIETAAGDTTRLEAAYGTARGDTAQRPDGTPLCGDTDNGFGLLFNWNLLGDGEHTVAVLVDGVELGRATVTVTTVGVGAEAEFLRSAVGACVAEDFPSPGETVTLAWQEPKQNFVITGGTRPAGESRAGIAGVGNLENPGRNSFQSGVGLISGWVCDAATVEIALGTLGRQAAAYGTERLDTLDTCGDTDNGFGLLFNWNLLGAGEHTVVALVDGEELGRAVVRVTTVGTGAEAEFLQGAEGACMVEDFPLLGETVTLEWQQTSQNFVITHVE